MKIHHCLAILALFLTGCNLFSFMDSPSGDAQLLSAARGAFDRGDYASALKYYGLISSANADQADSEDAFAGLAQSGMTVGTFMSAVLSGSSNGGKLVTKMAETMIPNSGSSNRLNVFHAYQKVLLINNATMRGLVRFVTALTLMAEILAEGAGSATKLSQADIVINPSQCLAVGPSLFVISDSVCGKPSGSKLISGSSVITLSTATDSQMSGSPSLQMIYGALNEVNTGISEMGASSSLGSSTSQFSSNLLAATITPDPSDSPGFRGALIYYNVGE